MKSKIFKKLVAGAATLAMVAQLGFVLPAGADGGAIEITPTAATYVDGTNCVLDKQTETTDNTGKEFSKETVLKTGYNKISGGKVAFGTEKWGANYVALMKFDVSSSLNAGEQITKAVLSYKASCDSARGRNHIVGSTTKKDWVATATYASFGTDGIPFAQIGEGHALAKGASNVEITQDVTDYAKAQTDNILAFVVIDTAAGGSDIAKDSIKLSIEKLDPTSQFIITYDVDGTKTSEVVKKGEQPANIPAPTKNGYVFDGWQVGDTSTVLTSEQVKTDVTSDTVLTAKFSVDSNYVQSIGNVEFVSPITTAINYPTEEGKIEDKPYTVKVTSDIGADITEDCTFTWEIAGQSDDGYVDLNSDDANKTGATRNLRVRQGGEGCFGYIKVTAAYTANTSDTPKSAQVPYAVVSPIKTSGQILPATGYPINMDDYKDNMVGYKATGDDLTKYEYDLVLNNWCIGGSNAGRDMELVKGEDGKKAIKFSSTGGDRGGTGSSTVATAAFPSQTAQYILETTVKFDGNGRLGVWDKTPNNGGAAAEWSISYDSGAIKAGEGSIAGINKNEWYKVVVTSDPSSKLYSVYVYDLNNVEKGSITGIAGGNAGKFLCVDSGFPVYINSLRAYEPKTGSISITSDKDVVQVPETAGAAANTVELTANCVTADGIKLTGAVTWSLAQEYQGVEIVQSTTNKQQATLKVSNGAAGEIIVNAAKDGKTASKTITLTTSANVVTFSQTKSTIQIPFKGEAASVAVYKAETVGKPEELPADKTITYSYLDKSKAPMEKLPKGITAKVADNTLTITVEAGTAPTVFYIKATDADKLSATTQVNVSGLSYCFGTDEVEGYTPIKADTLYNDTRGYGFESVDGLTNAATNVSGTAAYKFKKKLSNGNYTIEVATTSATIYSEIVDAAVAAGANVTGIEKSGSKFEVAVCDEVLDLTFAANSNISTLTISQSAAKEKREKPAVFAIGDSTTKNKDGAQLSWGNCVEEKRVEVPSVFSGFENHGQAGRDSVNFYNQGRIETVLLKVCPGDYVTINMGINARTESGNVDGAHRLLMEKYYAQAVEERGGIPVMVTATPDGPNGGYKGEGEPNWGANFTGGKFTNNRGSGARNDTIRGIAEDNGYNLIELGKAGEDWMNTLTMDDVTAYNAENGTSFDSVSKMVASWYPDDHNHYSAPLGIWIGNYILGEVKNMVENPFALDSVAQTATADKITLTATVKDGASKGSETFDVYVAQYNAAHELIGVSKEAVTFTNAKTTAEVSYTKDANADSVKVFVWDSNMKPYLANTAVTVAATPAE